jgi:MFS family permease
MAALLAQALMGMFSDHSKSRFGRRRPFIAAGTMATIVVLAFIGISAEFNGMSGYWLLFGLVILQMIAINTAHGAQQGLIPDLIPVDKRGRFSAVKAILEVPVPIIIVALTIGQMISRGQIWPGLITLMAYLLVVMLITMLVPEKPAEPTKIGFNWKPFTRLVLMTASFTIIILAISTGINYLTKSLTSIGGTLFLVATALVGSAGIATAVLLGVWFSTRVALGKEARKNKSFTWWVVSRLAFLVGSTNLVSFAVYFLQGNFGFDGESAAGPAANLTMFVGIFVLVAALPGGWLTDKFGRKPILFICGLLASLGTAIVIVSPPSLWLLYTGGSLIGLATGLFYTANWALGTMVVPPAESGKYLGISNLAGAGAGAIGAYIGGPIADLITKHNPGSPGIGYIILFIMYALLFIVSTIALFGIKEK